MAVLMARTCLAIAAVAALAGCLPDPDELRRQGSETAPADSGMPFQGACDTYASNFCAAFVRCGEPYFRATFGTEEQCLARKMRECAIHAAPGSRWPSQDCADAYEKISCAEFRADQRPTPCLAAGDLEDGTTCVSDVQCRSRSCLALFDLSSCGQCTRKQSTGEPCLRDEICEAPRLCAANQTCQIPADEGAPCGEAKPCSRHLVCRAGTCRAPGRAGDPCEVDTDCARYDGFGCFERQCRAYVIGGTCRALPDGTAQVCAGNGRCNIGTGACAAYADGRACEANQDCLSPEICINRRCAEPPFEACSM